MKMEVLMKTLAIKRTWRQKIVELRQRLYLRRRGYTWRDGRPWPKRALAKALRQRLAKMSQAEAYAYYGADFGARCRAKIKVENKHKRERLMIVSILSDMYANFAGPNHLGVPDERQ